MKFTKNNVYRMTIDEQLDEDLFRILVSTLDPEISRQPIYSIRNWSPEVEILITNTVLDRRRKSSPRFQNWQSFGTLKNKRLIPHWNSLQEGQVFLYGAFQLMKEGEMVFIDRDLDSASLHRIDLVPQLDDYVKQLYFNVLRSDRNASYNK